MAQKQPPQPVTAQVVEKMRTLSPECLGAVEDSSDSLSQRDEDLQLSSAAIVVSHPVLNAIWDNPDDAEYDEL